MSPETRRYLISSRAGGRIDASAASDVDRFVAEADNATLVKATRSGHRAVELTDDQVAQLAARRPDLLIEEDPELELFPMPGLPPVAEAEGEFSFTVTVRDEASGAPVPDATIYAIGRGPAYKARTDASGQAVVRPSQATDLRVIVSPAHTHWSRVIEAFSTVESPKLRIGLAPLSPDGRHGWAHRLLGLDVANRIWTGREVNVAIIDSGVTSDHDDLRVVGGLNTLDGADPGAFDLDEKGHGTHCAGVVAALHNEFGVRGGAPNARIYSVKVFPGGFVSDLIDAVEWCVANGVDVINMSLGSSQRSSLLGHALRRAYDRGITCVAAAGNHATHVPSPAAFPTVIAVGAVGRFGTFPSHSAHALKIGRATDWKQMLFSAAFTNFGREIDFAAPGVAVMSTVPGGYAAWDGTSMAAPQVTALAALALEAYPEVRTGDAQQSEWMRSILQHAAVPLGMPPLIEGRGLPLASRALPSARRRWAG